MKSAGQVIFAFFKDCQKTQKGLRPGSIRSYRDTLKLFLAYVASNCHRRITRLILPDLSAQRVLDFLQMIEITRGNHVSTRNQKLAALHTFYRYVDIGAHVGMDAKRPVVFRLCGCGRRRWLGGDAPEDHSSGLLNGFQTLAEKVSVSVPKLDYVVFVVILSWWSKGAGLPGISCFEHNISRTGLHVLGVTAATFDCVQ